MQEMNDEQKRHFASIKENKRKERDAVHDKRNSNFTPGDESDQNIESEKNDGNQTGIFCCDNDEKDSDDPKNETTATDSLLVDIEIPNDIDKHIQEKLKIPRVKYYAKK